VARDESAAVDEVLVRYGRERLLHRLSLSPHVDRFVLKGAALFHLWTDSPHRPTRDIDLLGFGSLEAGEVEDIFREICSVPVEPDGLEFDAATVRAEEIRGGSDYGGVRVKLLANLGRARVNLQVDVGIGDAVRPSPVLIRYPTILTDLQAPELRAYPREAVVAEKTHAIVKLGLVNSRMKDYYDLYVLCREFEFEGSTLCEALLATFSRRKTALPDGVPSGLSEAFADDATKQKQWRSFVARGQLAYGEVSVGSVVSALRDFLSPALNSLAQDETLDRRWPPGGPWL